MLVRHLKAREILDSRGKPTVEVDIAICESKNDTISYGRGIVPSGASLGSREACELRDNNHSRYRGAGVLEAVNNVNSTVSEALLNKPIASQKELDSLLIKLDGTENKSRIGANAILAVSLAYAHACAAHAQLPLYQYFAQLLHSEFTALKQKNIDTNDITTGDILSPMISSESANKLLPMVNVLNGGQHASNNINIQEFMIIPIDDVGISDKIRIASEIFSHLKDIAHAHGLSTNVGDEGGIAPELQSNRDALDMIMRAIHKAGYDDKVQLALDLAADSFYHNGSYTIEHGINCSTQQLIKYYESIIDDYPIVSLEDPMSEHDIEGWREISSRLGDRVQIVGDDLFVTNAQSIISGAQSNIGNGIIIKMNQVGTITETIATICTAKMHKYNTIVSHRSGETEDVSISHLAIGTNSKYIKTGSMCRTDRICKYNELIRIEEMLATHKHT